MAEKFLVHIENSAETYLCASDQDLLRGMEALGRRGIPVGCRGGGCSFCFPDGVENGRTPPP